MQEQLSRFSCAR